MGHNCFDESVSIESINHSAIFKHMTNFKLAMYFSSTYSTVNQLYTEQYFEYKGFSKFDHQTNSKIAFDSH